MASSQSENYQEWRHRYYINPLQPGVTFLYPLKSSEKQYRAVMG